MAIAASDDWFPLHEILQLEAVPCLPFQVPVDHRSLYPPQVVLPPEGMLVGQEGGPYQPELAVLPAVCHRRLSVLHVVQQAHQPFCHPGCTVFTVVLLQADAYRPPFFQRFVCRSLFSVSFHNPMLFFGLRRKCMYPFSHPMFLKETLLSDGFPAAFPSELFEFFLSCQFIPRRVNVLDDGAVAQRFAVFIHKHFCLSKESAQRGPYSHYPCCRNLPTNNLPAKI